MRTLLLAMVVTTAIVSGCGSGSGSDPTAAGSGARATSSQEELSAREIDALVAAGRIGEAHTKARLFVQSHPDSPFTPHVSALMGVHPHREGPR